MKPDQVIEVSLGKAEYRKKSEVAWHSSKSQLGLVKGEHKAGKFEFDVNFKLDSNDQGLIEIFFFAIKETEYGRDA